MTEAAEKTIRFREAQDKAEQEGKNEFICPWCGGKAWWYRYEQMLKMQEANNEHTD